MANSPCPKCHRKTWSAKWLSCTGCGYKEGQATAEGALATPAPRKKKPKAPFGGSRNTEGDGCPACGKSSAALEKRIVELESKLEKKNQVESSGNNQDHSSWGGARVGAGRKHGNRRDNDSD